MSSRRRWPVPVAAALFFSGLVAGWLVHPITIQPPAVAERVALLPTALHNLRVVAILAGGGLILGLPTVLVGAWNGFQSGALFAAVAEQPLWWIPLLLHGVPELGGQVCATASGLEILAEVVGAVAYGRELMARRALLWLALATSLTLVAAVVEWGVSPLVWDSLGQ